MNNLMKKLWKDNTFKLGILILSFFIFVILVSIFMGLDTSQNLKFRLLSPGINGYILGSDHFGRDVLSRLIIGARVSLGVGILASIISIILGLFFGLVSGYFGKKVDALIMRFIDIVMAFPVLLLLIAISATFEPSLQITMIAIGMVSWPPMARLIRAQVLMIRTSEFIKSLEALGFSHVRIILFHILPNCIAPIIVSFTLGISGAIIAESSLSFLGLGVQPPTPSWGSMINEGKDFLRISPTLSLLPGLAIAFTVLAFNLIGESIRDELDVKLEKE